LLYFVQFMDSHTEQESCVFVRFRAPPSLHMYVYTLNKNFIKFLFSLWILACI
jgi:hypothetical protein